MLDLIENRIVEYGTVGRLIFVAHPDEYRLIFLQKDKALSYLHANRISIL